uniref:Uncharacterized protein n=1 Tax=Variovorax paradoxus (strain S110) TaxID=543728 RepID=C5CJK5_VARPS
MNVITIDMDALARAIYSNTDASEQDARSIIHTVGFAAPAPASEAVAWNIPDQCPHMIVFDDAEASPLTFAGSGARPAALEAFKRKSIQWNAHLFVRIAHNSRDDTYPDATPGDSADAPVQQAGEYPPLPAREDRPALNAIPYRVYTEAQMRAYVDADRAALKGEQPVEPSGSERGEV